MKPHDPLEPFYADPVEVIDVAYAAHYQVVHHLYRPGAITGKWARLARLLTEAGELAMTLDTRKGLMPHATDGPTIIEGPDIPDPPNVRRGPWRTA